MKTFHEIINVLSELYQDDVLTKGDVEDIVNALVEDGFYNESDATYVCDNLKGDLQLEE